MQLSQHGVGRGTKWLSVVVNPFQIAGIAGKCKRNELQIAHVEASSNIFLDGLAKADGQLLTGVHCDALRCIRHEGVGQTAVDDCSDELIGVEHARVGDYRHGFDVAYLLNE